MLGMIGGVGGKVNDLITAKPATHRQLAGRLVTERPQSPLPWGNQGEDGESFLPGQWQLRQIRENRIGKHGQSARWKLAACQLPPNRSEHRGRGQVGDPMTPNQGSWPAALPDFRAPNRVG